MAGSRANPDPTDAVNNVTVRDRRDWDKFARLDPYWAILSDPDRRQGGWKLADFLATGEAELADALAIAAPHHGLLRDEAGGRRRIDSRR